MSDPIETQPNDTAVWMGAPLPRYQQPAVWTIDGEPVDMNTLEDIDPEVPVDGDA